MPNHFIEKYKKDKKFLEENHVYNEQDEHSSCGVGLIASLDGSETREIVELGVQALRVLYHRGAVDADGKQVMVQEYSYPYQRIFLLNK
jgi:glutamate synthase (NADPH/NADH) large chain